MRDIGKVEYCLGIEFSRGNNNEIKMKQEKYIEKLLDKFNMKSAKSLKNPMEVNLKLEKPTDEKLPDFLYQNLIGSLMYIATATRPDIMYP
ncbi:unnamed protein product, partial [Nesidiocoris tenuis]